LSNRSTILLGRILRNLKKHGLTESDVNDPEIYGELQSAQDSIISEIFPDRIVTITLKEDQETYPLTTETVTNPALTTYKNNIMSAKVVKQPSGFLYPFRILSNTAFVKMIDGPIVDWGSISSIVGVDLTTYIQTGIEMEGTKDGVNTVFQIPEDIVENSEEIFFNGVLQIRGTDYSIINSTITILHSFIPVDIDTLVCNYIKYSALGNSIVGTYQPLIGTVVGGRLKIYPIPTSSYEGVEIELYVYQKNSAGTIDADNEPEIDVEWDKALEVYTTAQFLTAPARGQFLAEFERERGRLRPITHHKKGTIQRESSYEGSHNERNLY
jgi:hypothetical protein